MKIASRITIAVLMAATLCMSGCGSNKPTESGNTNNQAASTTNTAANTSATATEEVKADKTAGGFDIDAYIANYTPKTELTNKGLFDYEVKVNGAVLTCPISTAELAALGYETMKPYTVEVSPDTVSRMNNYGGFYIHKESGVQLVLDAISTTSNESFVFDSDYPRDDVLFYDLCVNTNESYWEHDKSFTIEFYGGTVTNYDSQYNNGDEILTSEADLVEKCGKYNEIKRSNRYYYEFPESELPKSNMVSVMLNDNKNISSVHFIHKFDKGPSDIISDVKE